MQDDPKDFEKLRRILALKRNEVPPPAYFDTFSDKVIARIEADQMARSGLWRQVISLFRTRPAISWSFSVAAVLALFVAGNGVDDPKPNSQSSNQPVFGNPAGSAAAASMVFSTNHNPSRFGPTKLVLEPARSFQTNSEPKLDSLFSRPFYHQVDHRVQPAGYTP